MKQRWKREIKLILKSVTGVFFLTPRPLPLPPSPLSGPHTCSPVHAPSHTHTRMHTRVHAHTPVHTAVHSLTHVHIYTRTCTHAPELLCSRVQAPAPRSSGRGCHLSPPAPTPNQAAEDEEAGGRPRSHTRMQGLQDTHSQGFHGFWQVHQEPRSRG